MTAEVNDAVKVDQSGSLLHKSQLFQKAAFILNLSAVGVADIKRIECAQFKSE